jgi:hypothetical protein
MERLDSPSKGFCLGRIQSSANDVEPGSRDKKNHASFRAKHDSSNFPVKEWAMFICGIKHSVIIGVIMDAIKSFSLLSIGRLSEQPETDLCNSSPTVFPDG